MSRRLAIRKRCLDCSSGSHAEVEKCGHTGCSLYPFRTGQGKQNAQARDRAIKNYCAWCAGSKAEVPMCPVTSCPLWCFRKFKVDHPARTPEFCNERPYRGQFTTSDSPTHTDIGGLS